jgi:hypothetical protein
MEDPEMPRGVPKNRANGVNKMEAMRELLAEKGFDVSPKDLRPLLKSQYGINMDTSMISNYKSSIKGSGKSAMIRKPGRPVAAAITADEITLDDVRSVKAIVDRIGAEKVRKLAGVLGK